MVDPRVLKADHDSARNGQHFAVFHLRGIGLQLYDTFEIDDARLSAEKEAAERAEREHQEQLSKQKDALWEEQSNFEHTQKITNLAELAIATATKQKPKEKERKEFVVSVRCFDEELLQLKAAMNGLGIEFSVEELKF